MTDPNLLSDLQGLAARLREDDLGFYLEVVTRAIKALSAMPDRDEVMEALEPFAIDVRDDAPDDKFLPVMFSVGMFRRARNLYNKLKGGGE